MTSPTIGFDAYACAREELLLDVVFKIAGFDALPATFDLCVSWVRRDSEVCQRCSGLEDSLCRSMSSWLRDIVAGKKLNWFLEEVCTCVFRIVGGTICRQ